tara:strand:+ start:122 stop:511 length:390 start_codon:yes stop_codon:yes gene_type:complete
MHFCPKCGNMYYLRLIKDSDDQENALIYYCRNCGNEDDSLVSNLNNLYVSKTNIKTTTNYKNIINKYTKLDPTLPRITNIDCPNQDCDSNRKDESKEEKEILYIRYDDTNMKFIYLCSVCDTIWDTKTK